MSHSNHTFTNRIGFVLASVGSAIGMGNIWMFPYRLGEYGGAAFLIPYFFFVALFGYVGLSGEFALGRMSGTGPVGSYDMAMKSRNLKGGKLIGAIPLIGSFGIAIGYSVIVGWVLRSMFGSLTGSITRKGADVFFADGAQSFGSIPWHLIVVVLTAVILMWGITGGIERVNRFMMPAFLYCSPSSPYGYSFYPVPAKDTLICSFPTGRPCSESTLGSWQWDRPSSPCPSPDQE